ncbi:drebrin isoform X3 [Hippocampus comes]|uniref:drebrin isoform X3 n=1 Tax=Hippocampus comes TaxID=109280 RepID=UPI00094E39A2|nr:PREDICTED: drebrin isoform X3 [Hippocampus comes]
MTFPLSPPLMASSSSSSFSSSTSSSSSLIPRLSSISSGLDAPLGSNMAVNLAKNRLALLTAYQDVIDESTDTDWALYTYEDDSNDLTLASSGGGGLAEITLTFDNARVMYGFCSLKEPNAALPRYILINWVGDDVPDARKCACASHVATIADFFQGVAVIINASSLDDVDPSAIGQRLTNGTTVAASPVLSRLKTREEEHGDVKGTVYQKTNAEVEMKKINREEFWEQAKREEELRKEEERKKLAEERQRFEEERMELERKEQENRERRYRERERQIEEHRKKMQEEEEAKDRLQTQTTLPAELSIDDLSLDKKESEVEEAKAIIAQRSGNPREFFKQKERAMTISVDTSPVTIHRAGRLDSPFLRQQHSPSSPTSTPPPRGVSPLRGATAPHARTHRAAGENDEQASGERNMAAVSPIPKIVTTPIKEEANMELDGVSEWEPKQEQKASVQDSSAASKPVQSVAPQAREPAPFSTWDSTTDDLVDVWDAAPPAEPSRASSDALDLMGDLAAAGDVRSQPLLSFDDMMDGGVCSAAEDDPASLVDVSASEPMTLSYQHALQHAAGDGQMLMTNGEMLMKEATQASEGYFSQSQEEEFGQSEEGSAKPAPVLYNKPPEIDITCWDADPVADDDDDD